ncbi:hypothetical protein P3J6_121061 [Pseudoalteromonas sp. 3J6]|nr:hypothetical protein P3J6_121061 [Pseudoalteromonas sp. 3J6]
MVCFLYSPLIYGSVIGACQEAAMCSVLLSIGTFLIILT